MEPLNTSEFIRYDLSLIKAIQPELSAANTTEG
jgi:hypothetical protein